MNEQEFNAKFNLNSEDLAKLTPEARKAYQEELDKAFDAIGNMTEEELAAHRAASYWSQPEPEMTKEEEAAFQEKFTAFFEG